MHVKLIFPPEPVWAPIELVINSIEQRQNFQFMGLAVFQDDSNKYVAIYRHRQSKRYINADQNGQTYIFNGKTYDIIDVTKAVNHVLNLTTSSLTTTPLPNI